MLRNFKHKATSHTLVACVFQTTYDNNGNMTYDPNKNLTITYNCLNLPSKFSFANNNSIELMYDGAGQKLRKTVKTNGAVTLVQDYLGGIELKNNKFEAIHNEEGRAVYKTSLPLGGSGWEYEYSLKDHLGNTRVSFTDKNANGIIENQTEVLSETHYYPFGLAMNGAWYNDATAPKTKYLYNGKELNDEFGLNLNDYGARYYDADLARFLTLDPLADKYMGYSPYNYVLGNPIGLIDPDGEEPESSGPGDPHYIPNNPMYLIADSFSQGFKGMASWIDNTFAVGYDERIMTEISSQKILGGTLTTSTGTKANIEYSTSLNAKFKSLESAGPGNTTTLGWYERKIKTTDLTESTFSYKNANTNYVLRTTSNKNETTVEGSVEERKGVYSGRISTSVSSDGTIKASGRATISKGDAKAFVEGGLSKNGSTTEARAALGGEYKSSQGTTFTQSIYLKIKN